MASFSNLQVQRFDFWIVFLECRSHGLPCALEWRMTKAFPSTNLLNNKLFFWGRFEIKFNAKNVRGTDTTTTKNSDDRDEFTYKKCCGN